MNKSKKMALHALFATVLAGLFPAAFAAESWQANRAYQKGETVSHDGEDWQARWWSYGEAPGAEWGPWQSAHAARRGMATVAGGSFMMGATIENGFNYPNETPVHPVTLSSYQIGKTEVTFADYDRYTRATGRTPASSLDIGQVEMGRGQNPVINVTWFDAIKYINWLNQQHGWPRAYDENTGALLDSAGQPTRDVGKVFGYRLPTEAEWEYAARERGRDIVNAWGNGSPLVNGKPTANVADASFMAYFGELAAGFTPWPDYDDGHPRLAPVGSYPANALGVYDLSGNVWEWTNDGERTFTAEAQHNPLGPVDSPVRILRGASWDNTFDMHLTDRAPSAPTFSNPSIGFRLARSLPAGTPAR
ncbi:SUMF1/EgtB/PvdO family nonheme iron enzyme [Chitinilyticum aquatile]|uniref:SUMF1/EgtB/PvdO family nonheme iron enzyme n=1 Tax=Chitinilyticum aquatile TaxID=362520 RepID=UPI0006881697|nr:SUMF1/EgtB/PvdO family nonheme iron enzyme [Chitinilyticum aquatile]